MAGVQQIEQAVNELAHLHRMMRDVIREARESWRSELVRHRRALSKLVGRISIRLNESGPTLFPSPASVSEISGKLSRFRHVLAMHQASFPAVSINEATPDYRASIDRVQAASADFCANVRSALAAR